MRAVLSLKNTCKYRERLLREKKKNTREVDFRADVGGLSLVLHA